MAAAFDARGVASFVSILLAPPLLRTRRAGEASLHEHRPLCASSNYTAISNKMCRCPDYGRISTANTLTHLKPSASSHLSLHVELATSEERPAASGID